MEYVVSTKLDKQLFNIYSSGSFFPLFYILVLTLGDMCNLRIFWISVIQQRLKYRKKMTDVLFINPQSRWIYLFIYF